MGKVARTLIAGAFFGLIGCSGQPLSPPTSTTQQTVAYAGSAQTVSFTQSGGYSGTVTLPSGSTAAHGTFTVIESQTPFANQVAGSTSTDRTILSASPAPSATPGIQLAPYFQLTVSTTTTSTTPPVFSITFPSFIDTQHSVFIMTGTIGDPTAPSGVDDIATIGSVSGSTVTFTFASANYVFQAGLPYTYTITQDLLRSPSAITITPSTLSIGGSGAANARTATLSEPKYYESFSEIDSCDSIANIAMSSTSGAYSTITVTGMGNGTCGATFSDVFGEETTLVVNSNLGLENLYPSSGDRKAP